MKSNISQNDKIIRIALGVCLGLIALFTHQYWIAIVAIILLATAMINFCPLYALFGFSTRHIHPSPFHPHKKRKH